MWLTTVLKHSPVQVCDVLVTVTTSTHYLFNNQCQCTSLLLACHRHFLKLHPRQRTQFVDLLAATLHTLCDSARNLLSTDEDIHPGAVLQHKNGLNMCLYLLHTVAMQAQKDAQHGKGAENAVKTKTTGKQAGLTCGCQTASCNHILIGQ